MLDEIKIFKEMSRQSQSAAPTSWIQVCFFGLLKFRMLQVAQAVDFSPTISGCISTSLINMSINQLLFIHLSPLFLSVYFSSKSKCNIKIDLKSIGTTKPTWLRHNLLLQRPTQSLRHRVDKPVPQCKSRLPELTLLNLENISIRCWQKVVENVSSNKAGTHIYI